MTGQERSERLRARIKRAKLYLTGTRLDRKEIDEVEFAIRILDELRSYGPDARLRVNATGAHKFNIYDPTKSAGAKR